MIKSTQVRTISRQGNLSYELPVVAVGTFKLIYFYDIFSINTLFFSFDDICLFSIFGEML